MNDPLRLVDSIADMKSAIDRAIERKVVEMNARRGIEVQPAMLNPRNPMGGTDETGADFGFSTGYDGTNTIVPFVWGISTWGGGDIWTGS